MHEVTTMPTLHRLSRSGLAAAFAALAAPFAALAAPLVALAAPLAALAMFALWTAFPTAVRADHLDRALGADGKLYSVEAGAYGSLFPGSGVQPAAAATSAATSVVALDTSVAGSPTSRQLVPSSDSGSSQSSPALVYEDLTKTLFVVWISTNGQTSTIMLASYSGGQWSPPTAILSNLYATKTAPQLALTHDSHQEIDPTSGNPVTRQRTVLHIVWAEASATGAYQAFYAPVIFEDGVWIGSVPAPTLLNTYDAAEQTMPGGPFPTPLAYTPAVENGRDATTVLTGFASEASGLLTAVEVNVLPEELRILADGCAAAMVTTGAQYFPNQLTALASQAQTALVAGGGAFQPEVLQAIVTAAQTQILAGATDLPTMALKARATIIETGNRFSLRGMKVGPITTSPTPIAPSQIVEIVPPNGPSQFLALRVASTRPWPTVPASVSASALQMFLSRTGDNALAAWSSTDGSTVFYANTQPDGTWTATNQMQVTGTLDLTLALQVLQQRVY
jgi:hypothetical protein